MIQKIAIYLINLFDFFHKRKILLFLKKKKFDHFTTLFDIGAHKGESIDFFLSNFKVDKIVSFEASSFNFKFLKDNEAKFVKKFKYTNIIIENNAIGLTNKEVILNQLNESSSSTINEIDTQSSYFKKKFKILNFFHNDPVSKPIKTNLITLENYMRIKNIEIVDLLKIDTEGYEYEVLLGLKDKISNIKIIIFEHHYDNMIKKKYTYADINKLLTENNFEKVFKAKMPLRKTFEYIFINKRNRIG